MIYGVSIKVLTLIGINLLAVALLTLIFFVSKNLFKIYLERKHRVIGYRFRTKLVIIFVILTLIPSVFLFIVSGGLISTYIERWLNPQIRSPLENAYLLAGEVYKRERERTLEEARRLLRGGRPPANFELTKLKTPGAQTTETVRKAFQGIEGTEVISTGEGDIIRAAVPVKKGSRVLGVLVVEQKLPPDLVSKAEEIRNKYNEYLALYEIKTPIKINYLLALGFFTLLIVFSALWAAIKISRHITEPIQKLAAATDQISRGNLDISVDLKRDDELGMLINSFNRMVQELKENKESLQEAYLDVDRRRVCMENIVENIDSGVISLDEDRKVVTINSAAARILGINPLEYVGRDYTYLLKRIESEEFRTFIKGIRLSEFRSAQRQFSVKINEKPITIRVFITQLYDSSGRSLGILVVFEDMTEILRAQQALAWQEVARRIAHEIKNPLTPIKLSTERLLRKWDSGDKDFEKVLKNSTSLIIKEVESLQRMVNEFSKLGKMPPIKKTPVQLEDIIKETLQIYSDAGREINLRVAGDPFKIEIDPEQMKRALINLIDNAISASAPSGGEVSVEVLF
ncbi:MAG: HAMP domain-containing protein, partial [Nitrospirae bacterium]